jgi:small subunit ribosomal protein S7
MPRRRTPEKRKILPDPKYKDIIVAKFMNHIMKDGKNLLQKKLYMVPLIKLMKVQKLIP